MSRIELERLVKEYKAIIKEYPDTKTKVHNAILKILQHFEKDCPEEVKKMKALMLGKEVE